MQSLTPRPFRFGARFDRTDSRAKWLDSVIAAEALGYSSVFVSDHLEDAIAPFPALVVAAERTALRLGTLVLDNDFRHPAILAKEAASVDLLTEGRLELGVGAGWLRLDYQHSGIPYDEPRVRIERLGEAIAVLKGLFGPGPFSFQGRHYQIADMHGLPKPLQWPHPPLIIGGGGRRILELAGREANIVSVFYNQSAGRFGSTGSYDATAAATDEKVVWVREAAGERFAAIELLLHIWPVLPTRGRLAYADKLAPTLGVAAADVLEIPFMLVGTMDQMCEDLIERRERYGFSYIVVPDEAIHSFGPVVERLVGR